jgi:hypothetical protein
MLAAKTTDLASKEMSYDWMSMPLAFGSTFALKTSRSTIGVFVPSADGGSSFTRLPPAS